MASHDLVARLQEERRAEAAETRLGRRGAATSGSLIDRARLSLGLGLIEAGQLLGGDAARRRTTWSVPAGRSGPLGQSRRP
jgi:hypothetical protein